MSKIKAEVYAKVMEKGKVLMYCNATPKDENDNVCMVEESDYADVQSGVLKMVYNQLAPHFGKRIEIIPVTEVEYFENEDN